MALLLNFTKEQIACVDALPQGAAWKFKLRFALDALKFPDYQDDLSLGDMIYPLERCLEGDYDNEFIFNHVSRLDRDAAAPHDDNLSNAQRFLEYATACALEDFPFELIYEHLQAAQNYALSRSYN